MHKHGAELPYYVGSKQQRDLLQGRSVAKAGFARHLKKGTIYHLLAEYGDRLFLDEFFAGLYSTVRVGPAGGPSVLMNSPELKFHDRMTDAEVVERATCDYRWCVVSNTVLGE